jgi:hypothetical protein
MVNERLVKSMVAVGIGAAQPALLKKFVFPNIGGDNVLVPQLGPLGTYSAITTLASAGGAAALAVAGMKGKGPVRSAETQEYLLEYATAAIVSELVQDYVMPMAFAARPGGSGAVRVSPARGGMGGARRYDAGAVAAPFIPATPVPFTATGTAKKGVF